jgi:hypothetical protein
MSFSITRTSDGIVYNCYRAGCMEGRGFIPLTGPVPNEKCSPKPQYDVPDKPLRKLSPVEELEVRTLYGIDSYAVKKHGIKMREDASRLALH